VDSVSRSARGSTRVKPTPSRISCSEPVSRSRRVAAQAGAGELFTTETVQDLVAGSGFTFRDAGAPELKGLGPRRLLAVRAS